MFFKELDECTEDWSESANGNDKIKISIKRSWSLIDVNRDLRKFLINYNKAPNMALQLS